MFERIGGHVAGTHQVEQDAGISRAATRGHRYPVESGKSHRRVAADTAFERTDTCASAEVRCDDASAGEVWPAPFELGSDELIGQAMKSEALHAGVKQSAGNGEAAHEIRLCAMEGGVEARNLCDVGTEPPQSVD